MNKVKSYIFKCNSVATAVLLPLAIVLTAVEGTWSLSLQRSVPFIILVALLILGLGVTVYYDIARLVRTHDGSQKQTESQGSAKFFASFFCHLGLGLILVGGFVGAPWHQEGTLRVAEAPASMAVTREGFALPLPFSVELEEFRVDYYEDGESPKQYTSTLMIDGESFTTSVNHPCLHKGWLIYQTGYDFGAAPAVSVLTLVRDPWLPVAFLGMLLLAVGAVLSMANAWSSLRSPKRSSRSASGSAPRATAGPALIVPVALLLAALFALISLWRIRFGTLMPALRSIWFVPHLILYMLAYSALALALVCAAVALFGSPKKARGVSSRFSAFASGRAAALASRLLSTASALLALGMLCGAVWAKFAWGDYWTWDAKECWAAVTWLLTLLPAHLPLAGKAEPQRSPQAASKRRRLVFFLLILLAFLAMQVTWYGVDYLPSALSSLHTY